MTTWSLSEGATEKCDHDNVEVSGGLFGVLQEEIFSKVKSLIFQKKKKFYLCKLKFLNGFLVIEKSCRKYFFSLYFYLFWGVKFTGVRKYFSVVLIESEKKTTWSDFK